MILTKEDVDKIKADCPTAFRKLSQFMERRSGSFPQEELDTITNMALELSPRFLYEFFDEETVYIGIFLSESGGSDDISWSMRVKNGEEEHESDYSKTREGAERMAFNTAFKIVEERTPKSII